MRLEQLLDFIIGQLARSSSCTRVGHLTRPIPSRRLGNPSPMSNKSIAFTKKRREGVDEVGGVGGREGGGVGGREGGGVGGREGVEWVEERWVEWVEERGVEWVEERGVEWVEERWVEWVEERGVEWVEERAVKLALHAARSKQGSRAGESLVIQQTYFGDVQK